MKKLFNKMKTKTKKVLRGKSYLDKHSPPVHAGVSHISPLLKVRGYVSWPGESEPDKNVIHEAGVRVGRNKEGGFIAFPA